MDYKTSEAPNYWNPESYLEEDHQSRKSLVDCFHESFLFFLLSEYGSTNESATDIEQITIDRQQPQYAHITRLSSLPQPGDPYLRLLNQWFLSEVAHYYHEWYIETAHLREQPNYVHQLQLPSFQMPNRQTLFPVFLSVRDIPKAYCNIAIYSPSKSIT
ncbi:hypothetical protein CHUAL_002194 [Chamberlinius hualienensis]